jgi:hypothetical protein
VLAVPETGRAVSDADFLLIFIARRVESSWHALDRLRHHTTQLLVRIEHLALLLPRSDRREVRGACAALGWSGDQGPTSDKRKEIMALFCDATLKPACDAKIAKNMRKLRSSGKCSRKTCEKKHRSRKTTLFPTLLLLSSTRPLLPDCAWSWFYIITPKGESFERASENNESIPDELEEQKNLKSRCSAARKNSSLARPRGRFPELSSSTGKNQKTEKETLFADSEASLKATTKGSLPDFFSSRQKL